MKKIFLFSLLLTSFYYSQAYTSQENRLIAFAKLYSTVKFFYPDPHLSEVAWAGIAYQGYQLSMENTNDDEFVAATKKIFSTLAPGVQFSKNGFDVKAVTPPANLNMKTPAFWQHKTGLNSGDKADYKQLSLNYIYKKSIMPEFLYQQFSPVAKKMNGKKVKISFWAKLEGDADSVKLVQLTPFSRKTKIWGNFPVMVTSKEWKKYEEIITYPEESEVARLNLVFPNSGTAYIDNLEIGIKEGDKWEAVSFKNTDFENYDQDGDLSMWDDPFVIGSIAKQETKDKKAGNSCLKLKGIQDQKMYEPLAFDKPTEIDLLNGWKAFVPNQLMSNDSVVFPFSKKNEIDILSKKYAAENNSESTQIKKAIAAAIETYCYLLQDHNIAPRKTESALNINFFNGIHALEKADENNSWNVLYVYFLAWIGDAQIYVRPTRFLFNNTIKVNIPCESIILDGKIIVQKPLLSNEKLKAGDWIKKIGNFDMDSLLAKMNQEHISGYLQETVKSNLFNNYFENELELQIIRNGKLIKTKFLASENIKRNRQTIDSYEEEEMIEVKQAQNLAQSKEVLYFNAVHQNVVSKSSRDNELNYKQMDSLVTAWNNYKTIIIDYRDPQQTRFLEYLVQYLPNYDATKSYESEKISFMPFGSGTYHYSPSFGIEKRSIALKSKLIVLTNHNTRALTEMQLISLSNQNLIQTVGTQTAGSGGHVNQVKLSNDVRLQFTCMGTVGKNMDKTVEELNYRLQPDVLVQPSLEGLKNSKDEVLLKAISIK